MKEQPGSAAYEGLTNVSSSIYPHLGGNIKEGDAFTYSPAVWDYIIGRFAIRSVLDVGSGLGYSCEYFFRKGLRVIAVDGLPENVVNAVFPTVQFDLTTGSIQCKVDLVHCQEVVEHIGCEYLENLLSTLAAGKIILLTNALPGQCGHHHVNEQPTEYWIENLSRYDCHLLQEDTRRIRRIAEAEGATYLARTGTLYANRKRF
jgi:SAM-dependent methyltransferase